IRNGRFGYDQWIPPFVFFQFFFGAVFGRVGHGVPFVPVGPHFEESGPVTAPCALHRFVHCVMNGYHVHAIDRCAGHVETEAHLIDVAHVGCAAHGCTHGVAVVLAHENNRELPQHRHVKGFVECALPDSAVAHITYADAVEPVIFVGECNARTEGNLAAYDTMPAHEFVLFTEEVHGATLSFGASGSFAEQLGHGSVGRYALGDGMRMAAVSRNHRVFRA